MYKVTCDEEFMDFYRRLFLRNIILVLVALAVNYSSRNDNGENGIVLFDEPGEILSTQPFEVFQVLDHGAALAREIDKSYASWNATTEIDGSANKRRREILLRRSDNRNS